MYSITVSLDKTDSQPIRLKRIKPAQTLLEVLINHGISIHHHCGGICHCTTCHLFVEKGEQFIEEKTRREADFLNKVKDRKPGSRLACQCLLVEGKGEIELIIPNND